MKVAGRWRYVYRAIDQFGQVIDVFVAPRRDAKEAHRFFERAMGATKVTPVEVTTDKAPVYPAVLEELLPAAWHRTDRYANNRVECDHGRLKARLRPMRGLKHDRSARVVIAGHALVQNLRADTTSWRLTGPPAGEWRSRSTNWSWRSDPSRCWPSACPGSAQRNSADAEIPSRGGSEDLGEAEQVGQLEAAGGGGGQGRGPAGGAQDRVVAASDQPDEDLGDDGAAHRA